MKTEGVEAGEAYSKHKVSAQVSACDATRVRELERGERGTRRGVRGLEREAWSVEGAVGNLQLQTQSQSDEN
jgi:hypothetical protein